MKPGFKILKLYPSFNLLLLFVSLGVLLVLFFSSVGFWSWFLSVNSIFWVDLSASFSPLLASAILENTRPSYEEPGDDNNVCLSYYILKFCFQSKVFHFQKFAFNRHKWLRKYWRHNNKKIKTFKYTILNGWQNNGQMLQFPRYLVSGDWQKWKLGF